MIRVIQLPRRVFSLGALIAGLLACFPGVTRAAWQLVWSDEFNQPDGSSPNPTNWTFETGNNGGWGNNELEYYTSRTNNARIENGQLVITAIQESFGGQNYTSARMKTQGLQSWTYGRMEASIKIPRGQGLWPAFWMLGTNIGPPGVGWPTCGEIDIMENIGKTNNNEQAKAYGTIHGPQGGGDYNGGAGVGGTYTLPGGGALADNFHLYAIEWTTNQIKWFVDSNLYFTATPASLPGGSTWVFTAPQFILLNVAVGGNFPGNPSNYTVFPQQMLVDYVRVYTQVLSTNAADPPTGLTAGPSNSKVFLNWNVSTNSPTAYYVQRSSVSGGPYTTLTSVTTNSYTDTAVSSCSTYYYVVSATNSYGGSTNSNEAAATLGSYVSAVNSGGSMAGQFVTDANFSGGTQAAPFTATFDTTGVISPAPQAVYQTERYGAFSYTFPGLPSGLTYKVRLHFAEGYWTAVGQRKFNVAINGTQVLSNFDIIAATGGQNRANVQEFNVVPSSGQIVVQYSVGSADQPKSSGIEILLPPPAAPLALTANAGDSVVALNWNASTGATSYNVKRALVNNGPYAPLASGLTTTNYIDTGLTNGTVYFYVVSAVRNCEGTNSPQVSATPVCSPPPAPTAGNNGPIWAGTSLNLTASTVTGATYGWTGPGGFTSSDQNPSIAAATTNASGTYSVVATVGSCVSTAGTTMVTVNPVPALSFQVIEGTPTLSWPTGTLVMATNLSGPWSSLSNAPNPYSIQPVPRQQFYRLKLQ
jgi:beta-glucanase (GH16 family)